MTNHHRILMTNHHLTQNTTTKPHNMESRWHHPRALESSPRLTKTILKGQTLMLLAMKSHTRTHCHTAGRFATIKLAESTISITTHNPPPMSALFKDSPHLLSRLLLPKPKLFHDLNPKPKLFHNLNPKS